MLLLLFLAAALAPSQRAALECANVASAQTEPAAGPGGSSAIFKVTTEDDHSKNSHECNAEYQLLISAAGGAPHAVDVLTSVGDWGRSLSLRLSGFSQDGKRAFGFLPKAANISSRCSSIITPATRPHSSSTSPSCSSQS